MARTGAKRTPQRHGALAIKEGRALRVLQLALERRKQVAAVHRGRLIAMSPHVIGRKGPDLYVLAFGVVTGPQGVAPLRWQWLPVVELEDLTLRQGFWLTAPGERPSADFLSRVLAEATPLDAEDEVPGLPAQPPEDELPTL